MKEVKTIGIHYIPGEKLFTQRHKKGERPHYGKNGAFVNPTGFGYATETKPSKLILIVDTGEGMAQVRIDRYFKDRKKKITEKRRSALAETMPKKVHIERQVSDYGNSYMGVDETDMDAWSKAAGIK